MFLSSGLHRLSPSLEVGEMLYGEWRDQRSSPGVWRKADDHVIRRNGLGKEGKRGQSAH